MVCNTIVIATYIIIANGCWNDAGYSCKFPFEYNGKTYYECTRDGAGRIAWCYDKRGDGHWDYCSNCRGKYDKIVYLIES